MFNKAKNKQKTQKLLALLHSLLHQL